jgi:quinol monooxygenase YgiN
VLVVRLPGATFPLAEERTPMTDSAATSPATAPVHLIPWFVAKPGFEDDLRQLLAALQTASRRDDGCLEYSVFSDEQDPRTFLLYEKWTSSEALDAHNEQQHVKEFLRSAEPFMAGDLRVHRLRPIS